jgi:hypothetical protein
MNETLAALPVVLMSRFFFESNCVSAGIDSALLNALLGHSQEGMDKHYVHPSKEDLQNAMGKYTRWLNREAVKSVDQSVDNAI